MCKKYDIKLVLFAVPPRVGGWIEILKQGYWIKRNVESHPVWAGGLKLILLDHRKCAVGPAPRWAGELNSTELDYAMRAVQNQCNC